MAIDKPSDYFNTVLYTGNGGTQSVTGVGFQPDLVWNKSRSSAYVHGLNDVVRGAGNTLISNSTDEEQAWSAYFTSFDSDGFSMASGGGTFNASSVTYTSWNWLAGGTAVSNTDGSITSSVSANTTAGFSIVSYTGTASSATVGHGLGVTPAMIIVKDRTNSATSWVCWNKNFSNLTNDYIILNNADAKGTYANYWGTSAPTLSVFGVGSGGLDNNKSSASIIAYCFAEVKGYSKFGKYTGNGSTDGTFVYTGFKPAFVVIKRTDGIDWWGMWDSKRNPSNAVDKRIYANTSDAEQTIVNLDILSNGFKIRTTDGAINASGGTYIYMAFASNPFVTSSGIPVTAR